MAYFCIENPLSQILMGSTGSFYVNIAFNDGLFILQQHYMMELSVMVNCFLATLSKALATKHIWPVSD